LTDIQLFNPKQIQNLIFTIRGEQVMLDRHLSILYEVKTIRLREQVKRNIERFPQDFMFQLNENKVDFMVSQNAIPSKQHLGGHLPYVFTEQGVAMLSAVLKSKTAVNVRIQIMDAFVTMRKYMVKGFILDIGKVTLPFRVGTMNYPKEGFSPIGIN